MKNLNQLLNQLEYTLIGALDCPISTLCFDSRKVEPQSLFICIKGLKTDGHQFIEQAIEQGASAIVVERDWLEENQAQLNQTISWLGVKNTDIALATLAANFYGNPAQKMNLIGITGTNGKTTTAHLVEYLYNQANLPTGMIGTLYYRFQDFNQKAPYTSPFPLELHQLLSKMSELGAQNTVMECSSHALHQHRLDALQFTSAIFTNLSQDHLDYHQTMEDYLQAKMYLFTDLLKPEGKAIINLDDPVSPQIVKQIQKEQLITYGVHPEADFRATEIVNNAQGIQFQLVTAEKTYPIQLQLVGHFNLLNSLAALAAVSRFIPLEQAIQSLELFSGVPGRFEKVSTPNAPITVIVDYAHTPDSLENLLVTARQFAQRKIICVFGCGGDRDRTKRPLMGAIADKLSDLTIVTSDNPRSENPDTIIKDIVEGMSKNIGMVIQPDRRKAISQAILFAKEGDVVLIAGKGHEDYQILKDKTIHFDDRLEAKKVLETLCHHPS